MSNSLSGPLYGVLVPGSNSITALGAGPSSSNGRHPTMLGACRFQVLLSGEKRGRCDPRGGALIYLHLTGIVDRIHSLLRM
jgi:hypothetical protein